MTGTSTDRARTRTRAGPVVYALVRAGPASLYVGPGASGVCTGGGDPVARYATVDDVATRLGRELTPAERTRAAALLDDAETVIRTRIPDLETRVAGGRLAAEVVRLVVVAVVVRMLRNPGGYRSETAGDYSYQVDARAASGVLDLLPVEWRWLGLDVGAWSITPHARPAAWPWWARHRDHWTWGPSPDGWPVDPP